MTKTIYKGMANGFQKHNVAMLEKIDKILASFDGQKITLRQLHYQLVSKFGTPNDRAAYNRLSDLMTNARNAGRIDWDALEDRTHNLIAPSAWSSPSDLVHAAASAYKENPWAAQEHRPEVWIEKDALTGVIDGVCRELRVPYYACKGFDSTTEKKLAGDRLREYIDDGQTPIIFYLGDFDPRGLDMSRDTMARVELYVGEPVEVRRLALNPDQITDDMPTAIPKKGDICTPAFIKAHGNRAVELDVLPTATLVELVREAVEPLIDWKLWDKVLANETKRRSQIYAAAEHWDDVQKFLKGKR